MNKYQDEAVVKLCIELLSELTTSTDTNTTQVSERKSVDDVIQDNLQKVRNSFKFKSLKIEDGPEFSWNITITRNKFRWYFVCTCLQLLKTICNVLQNTQDEKVKLLSVSQKKILESTFQFIVSLALLPNLIPGVGISPEAKIKHINNLSSESLKDFAKYRRLCFVLDSILYLKENDVFHEIIMLKYFEDVLAALFQLVFAPVKKPTTCENSSINFETVDDEFEISEMSSAMWIKLEENKNKYRNHLLTIQKQTYKPLIIRKYLVLLEAKKTPRWMKQNLTKMLNDIILEEDGVVALIKAIVEVGVESPVQWSHCDVVARLISNSASSFNRDQLQRLIPQILKILRYGRKQQYEYIYIQVMSLAVKLMLSQNLNTTAEAILNEILNPLKFIENSSEDGISTSIEQLYNLCVLPTNTSNAVSIDITTPVIHAIFLIYCKVKDSVSYLKSPTKELLETFIRDADDINLTAAFDSLIFNEKSEKIVQIPNTVKFVFSSNGGVIVTNEESEQSQLENGVLFFELIKNTKNNDRPVNFLFVYLLRKFLSINDQEHGEKRLISVILLTELSQNEATLKQILKNSQNIMEFIKDLLIMNSHTENSSDVVCVCLTFLTMVLYDLKKKKNVDWKTFDNLQPALQIYKKSIVPEVKILADEVHNLIVTRSLVGKIEEDGKNEKLIEEIDTPSACELAFEDACDNLLPVRAHGLMELISLLLKGDEETLAKIDKILCLFQENMKDKDSFLYLRAIEGLSTIALLKPDKILPLLCEEFISCNNTETRLKVGEILMRTVKLLQDFVPSYKHLLVNIFLNGAKSDDPLVRASSLSNLGEVCLLLKFNIEDVIYEISYCAQNIALHDKDAEPRRAAVFLISNILRGLETRMFKVLEPMLRDLYKNLRKIFSTDEDQATRIHAGTCLDVLNENTKQFFSVKPELEKKIRILDPC